MMKIVAMVTMTENVLKELSQRFVTFYTLITFLTIENNIQNIHSDPPIKSDSGQYSQFLQCFFLKSPLPPKQSLIFFSIPNSFTSLNNFSSSSN